MTLVAELEGIRQEAEANRVQAAALCDGLSEEQLAWRPQPGRWSIAENLVHLETTTDVFLPSVDRAIEEARRRKLYGNGPFRLGMIGRLFVWYVEPPPAIRLPAPRPLRPLLEGPATEALPQFLKAQDRMLERVEASNGLDLARARTVSPLASYIRMNLLAFFRVFTGHERRHLWQAANVRQRLLEPAPSTRMQA